jgi:hypothetical protein
VKNWERLKITLAILTFRGSEMVVSLK